MSSSREQESVLLEDNSNVVQMSDITENRCSSGDGMEPYICPILVPAGDGKLKPNPDRKLLAVLEYIDSDKVEKLMQSDPDFLARTITRHTILRMDLGDSACSAYYMENVLGINMQTALSKEEMGDVLCAHDFTLMRDDVPVKMTIIARVKDVLTQYFDPDEPLGEDKPEDNEEKQSV